MGSTLNLEGSPEDMGRRHGRALAGEIRQMRRSLIAYLARLSLYAGALPLFGGLVLLARRFLPHVPPRFRREMAAVAAGAGVGPGTVLLINTLDDLANNSPRCSVLAVGEAHSESGAYLMGRNLDYPLFIDTLIRLQTLFLLEPQGRQPVASVAWPGYVGVCTGSNRAGVALAQLAAMSLDRSTAGVPAALRFREALEEEATVAAVSAHIQSRPGTIGNNLMLCGPGEAAVLELSARRGALRHPEAGLLTATNHYQSPAMADLRGKFPPRLPFSPLSPDHFTEAYSRARDARLRELAAGRKLGPEDIQKILADPQIANPGTTVCAVFAPARGILWLSRRQTPPVSPGPFEEIRLWA